MSKPLEWIWDGLIPRGKVTLITGEPGVGKSLFTLQVAAMVTRGWTTPPLLPNTLRGPVEKNSVGHPAGCPRGKQIGDSRSELPSEPTNEPGAVLLFSADDGLVDTIRPRLESAGADLSRILVQFGEDYSDDDSSEEVRRNDRPSSRAAFRVERDLRGLEETLLACRGEGVDVRLIVIDPIDCYFGSSAKQTDLSRLANGLVKLAERSGAAVLVVANSTSTGIGRTGYRTGTIGHDELANAARSVLMVVQDLECDEQRMVLPVKLNLSATRPGMAFSIRNGAMHWSSKPIPLTGDEYFTQAKEKRRNPLVREECSELARVTNWLRDRLSDGRAASVAVRADACQNEIAYTTLRRAFRRLGCQATKEYGVGRWYWRLPGSESIMGFRTSDDVADVASDWRPVPVVDTVHPPHQIPVSAEWDEAPAAEGFESVVASDVREADADPWGVVQPVSVWSGIEEGVEEQFPLADVGDDRDRDREQDREQDVQDVQHVQQEHLRSPPEK